MKITKRQLRRIIKEEKAKILSEGLNFGSKDAQDVFGRTEQQFRSIAQEFGWNMTSIEGEIEDDVGSGDYRATFNKGEDIIELSYSYVYQPYGGAGNEMEYYLKTSVGQIDGEFSSDGWQDDLIKLFQAYNQAQSMDLQRFKSLVERG
jgi:hypothetical protein